MSDQSSLDLRPEQLAPHSIEAEEAVLGSVLISPDFAWPELRAVGLRGDDFFIVRNDWIWEALCDLAKRGDPVDFVTVVAELEARDRLAEMGGAAFILSLINKTPSALNVDGYARVVQRLAIRRRLIEAAGQIARVAHSEETELDDVLARSEAAIRQVTMEGRSLRQLVKSGYEAQSDYFDYITELAANEGAIDGIRTGIPDLDKDIKFLPFGEVMYVIARPGEGKSGLLTTIAWNNMKQGIPVGFISLEMSDQQMEGRLTTLVTKIPTDRMVEPHEWSEAEWASFMAAQTELEGYSRQYNQLQQITPLLLEQTIEEMLDEAPIQLICLDYLQLMESDRDEKRHEELEYISRRLKLLAAKHHIAIIAACQSNRNIEYRSNSIPKLSDIHGSSAMEKDGYIIMFIVGFQDENENYIERKFYICKNRNGNKNFWIPIGFNGPLVHFYSPAYDYQVEQAGERLQGKETALEKAKREDNEND